jgi:hypothetical protein
VTQTLHQLLDEAEGRDLLVCNLFQMPSGAWRSNLYKVDDVGRKGYEFGEGPSVEAALRAALDKVPAEEAPSWL